MRTEFARRLIAAAAAPYLPAWRFDYQFAREKLGGDPVFTSLLERGLIPDNARILDLGCGQGLLASWLLAARSLFDAGDWPAHWPRAPKSKSFLGVELMLGDVERARRALAERARFIHADVCATDFGKADVIVILDVLHYFDYSAQLDVLSRAKEALSPAGLLLMRVGDAQGGLPFLVSNWVDRLVTFARGHRLSRFYCRSLQDWTGLLRQLGFTIESIPMSRGTPFANALLIARLGSEGLSCYLPLTRANPPL